MEMEEEKSDPHKFVRLVRGLFILVSFLIPLFGILVGVLYIRRGDPELRRFGKICMAFGIFSMMIFFALSAIFYLQILNFINGMGKPTPTISIDISVTSSATNWTMTITKVEGDGSSALDALSIMIQPVSDGNQTITYRLADLAQGAYHSGVKFNDGQPIGFLTVDDSLILDRNSYGAGTVVNIVDNNANSMLWSCILNN